MVKAKTNAICEEIDLKKKKKKKKKTKKKQRTQQDINNVFTLRFN